MNITNPWIISDDGKCFLCGEPDADYTTHVRVDDWGHLRVDVHMTCLIEKGNTKWKSIDTPQITGQVWDAITDHDFLISMSFYIQDNVLFLNEFPQLREETLYIAVLLQRAADNGVVAPTNALIGTYTWHGILRPVDYLVAIRQLKGQVESEQPWALVAQSSLMDYLD